MRFRPTTVQYSLVPYGKSGDYVVRRIVRWLGIHVSTEYLTEMFSYEPRWHSNPTHGVVLALCEASLERAIRLGGKRRMFDLRRSKWESSAPINVPPWPKTPQ